MEGSNLHANMDEANMHNSKGFSIASKGYSVWKNELNQEVWDRRNILPKALKLVSSAIAPPTEVDGDIYLIGSQRVGLTIVTIAFVSGSTIRYSLSSTDLSTYVVGDYLIVIGATNSINNGSFVITNINDGSNYLEVTNDLRTDDTDDEGSGATGTSTLSGWDGCRQNSWVKFNLISDIWSEVVIEEQGILCYNDDENCYYIFQDSQWQPFLVQPLPYLILRSTGVSGHRWKLTVDDTGQSSWEDLGV